MDYLSIIAAKDAQIEQLAAQVQHLGEALALAHMEVEGLKRQLNLTSQTSSKPPSSDGLRKPKSTPAFEREKGKTPRGGKAGHRGDTLKFSDRVDEQRVHAPQTRQCACGADLSEAPLEVFAERRQTFDLPNLNAGAFVPLPWCCVSWSYFFPTPIGFARSRMRCHRCLSRRLNPLKTTSEKDRNYHRSGSS